MWKAADIAEPTISGPSGRGWKMVNGNLEIEWCKVDPLPEALAEIVCTEQEDEKPPSKEPAPLDNVNSSPPEDEDEPYILSSICDSIQEEGFDDNDQ